MRREKITTRALTTIELLVVIVILVLLATISFTSLAGRNRTNASFDEARKIQQLLATARSFALGKNGYFQAVVWLDQPSYWIDEIDQNGNIVQPKIVTPEPLDENVVIPDILVDSIVQRTGKVTIRFFPQGNSSDASIHLIRKGADQSDVSLYTTVKLYAPTGRANILRNQYP